jgi:hypothetical protein
METEDRLKFAMDRIGVLEQLVVGLLEKEGVSQLLIKSWRENVANWPDNERSLTADSIRLVETVRALKLAPRSGNSK